MRCSNCGHLNHEGSRFCATCGQPLQPQATGGVPSAPPTVAPATFTYAPRRTYEVKPLSKSFYLGSIIGGLGGGYFLLILGIVILLATEEMAAMGLVCVGYLPLIYATVIWCVFVYKMWAAIQDSPARTTPGKAVGFCFIPFFNFYWMFQVWWGWAQDYNRLIAARRIAARPLSENLALAMCILVLTGVIPYLGILSALVGVIMQFVLISKIIDGVNAIAEANRRVSGGTNL